MKRSSEIIIEIFLLSFSFLSLSGKREFYALGIQKMLIKKEGGLPCHKGKR